MRGARLAPPAQPDGPWRQPNAHATKLAYLCAALTIRADDPRMWVKMEVAMEAAFSTLLGRSGNRRIMTPSEYLRLSPSERARVVRVQPVPPSLGRYGFGALVVEFRGPVPTHGQRLR